MLLKSRKNKEEKENSSVSLGAGDQIDDLDLSSSENGDPSVSFMAEEEPSNLIDEQAGQEKKEEDTVIVSKSKMILINKLLKNVKENNEKVIQLLAGYSSEDDEKRISISQVGEIEKTSEEDDKETEGKIIEGVFDGENMIGPDGKQYNVPANYASKSKLVEGDILKLTITSRGTFVYKQIGPIERKRIVGQLFQENDGDFFVSAEGKKWHVLTASVTYYKGQSGDEAVILTPKNGDSKWAAVENIVNKTE